MDPLKIIWWKFKTNEFTKKSIILIRENIPASVKKELIKHEKGLFFNVSVVKKHFGKSYNFIINDHNDTSRTKKGKAEEPKTIDPHSQDQLLGMEDIPEEELFTIEEMEQFMAPVQSQPSSPTKLKSPKSSQSISPKSTKSNIQYFFLEDSESSLNIYNEDKIIEFKQKLFILLNIPIYRQHMWVSNGGTPLFLSYNIITQDYNIQPPTLLDLIKNTNEYPYKIGNIPIISKYIDIRDDIKIESNDSFTLFKSYQQTSNLPHMEYNIVDLNDFIEPVKQTLAESIKDKHQMMLLYYGFILLYWPMLSYTVFIDYLTDQISIYPELDLSKKQLESQFKPEKYVFTKKNALFKDSSRKGKTTTTATTATKSHNIKMGITYSIISVSDPSYESVIYLRNLFDEFSLDTHIDAIKCFMYYEGTPLILDKTFGKALPIKEDITINSIAFRIKLTLETVHKILVIFHKRGGYTIRATWREEDKYGFDDIYNIVSGVVSNLIDRIELLSMNVLHEGRTINRMTKHNHKFLEIDLSVFYNQPMTDAMFLTFKNLITDFYQKSNILIPKIQEARLLEYYFTKGMHQFDRHRIEHVSETLNIKNHYDYLSDGTIRQKWITLYEKTRLTKFYHRFSDIKIEITGIKDKEFDIFYELISTLFSIFQEYCAANPKICNINQIQKKKKKLRVLKEQDPVLYEFKKRYKSKIIYSKICQKPYQPHMISPDEYEQLNPQQKELAVKYKNFTTNADVYYICPNKVNPYIHFIIKRHPKNYGIPCCKKTPIPDDLENPRRIIHDHILKEYTYEKERRTITVGSRYIMRYSKDIEPDRLSKLPENSLDILFHESAAVETPQEGYYLYGVVQNTASVDLVGYLFCLSNAMETPVNDIIEYMIAMIRKYPDHYNIMLNGKISKYFADLESFLDTIQILFLNEEVNLNVTTSTILEEPPWNEIFIDISYLYMNINTVLFQDKNNDGNIELYIPSHLRTITDYFPETHKNLYIIQKGKKYYPIYYLDIDMFFKTKFIKTKLFTVGHQSVKIIIKMMENSLITDQKQMDLSVLYKFLAEPYISRRYTLFKLYINKSNLCYAVELKNLTNTKSVFFPIIQSSYSIDTSIQLVYQPYTLKDMPQLKTLLALIHDFNNWIRLNTKKTSAISFLSMININKWVVFNNEVIGFQSNGNMAYYFQPITLVNALKIKKAPIITLLYNPAVINSIIYNNNPPLMNKALENMGKSLYKYNLYQIFLLEFIAYFSKIYNSRIRDKINSIIKKHYKKDNEFLMKLLYEVVQNKSDQIKLYSQIKSFHFDKKALLFSIKTTKYEFDKYPIDKLKSLSAEKLIKELLGISKKFTNVVQDGYIDNMKSFSFPNIFTGCSTQKNKSEKVAYCLNRKLIIEKTKLNEYIHILASDIQNPIKEKWIFSELFAEKVIDFYKFKKRMFEHITLTTVTSF